MDGDRYSDGRGARAIKLADAVVKKPWGSEYLVFESPEMAVWLLHIEEGLSTSLHCHPSKNTGYLLLSGEAELGFIADSKVIRAPNKQMLRRGLFHRTKALSSGGVFVLEAENPNDKADLVRLSDSHGRGALGYESGSAFSARGEKEFWIDPNGEFPVEYVHRDFSFVVEQPVDTAYFAKLDPADIVMFLRGGVGKVVDGRRHLATVPGDIGLAQVIAIVASEMEFLDDHTLVLRVSGELN